MHNNTILKWDFPPDLPGRNATETPPVFGELIALSVLAVLVAGGLLLYICYKLHCCRTPVVGIPENSAEPVMGIPVGQAQFPYSRSDYGTTPLITVTPF